MNVAIWIIYVVLILAAIGVIIVVLKQESKSEGGMGAAMGGGGESFFSRNKSKTHEAKLVRATQIGGIIIAVLSIVLVILLRA